MVNAEMMQAQAREEAASHTPPIYGYVENSEEFAGNYVFEDGKLSKYLFDGGYIDIASGLNTAAYRFYVRDHLGSVRVVLDDDGNVLQQLYYHPFGGVWGDAGTNIGLQPWKYSGKEYDHRDGLDLYDYGARLYDPAAVRWTSPDPLCEKYYHISPYAFCNNNPIKYVDPDGKKIKIPHNQNQILGYINSSAQGVFAINKDGYLYMKKVTNKQGLSKYYAEKLNGLIKDPKSTVTILVSDKVKVPNSKTGKMETKATQDYGEGVTVSMMKIYKNTKEKSHDITTTISGKSRQGLKDQSGNALEDGPAEILSHEIVGHAAPKVLGSDTGNAVENENKVRLQLNKPLRERDDGHVE